MKASVSIFKGQSKLKAFWKDASLQACNIYACYATAEVQYDILHGLILNYLCRQNVHVSNFCFVAGSVIENVYHGKIKGWWYGVIRECPGNKTFFFGRAGA